MATFFSIAQAMPQGAAARPPDGRIGGGGENPQEEVFLSALRTALAGEEGGGKKTRGVKDDAESSEESSGQKKKDEILCTVFFGQMLNMLPHRNDDAQPVSGSGDAAGVIPAVEVGAEGTVLAGTAELSGNRMRTLPNLPAAGTPEPAVPNAQEAVLPQAWSQEKVSGRKTVGPIPVQADARTLAEEESWEQRLAPQIPQESDTVSGEEAPVSGEEAPVTKPVSPDSAASGTGEIRAERITLAEGLSAFEEASFSAGQAESGETPISDGETRERSGADEKPKREDTLGMAVNEAQIGPTEGAGVFSRTEKADAASQPTEQKEAYLQVSDRVMEEIKDGKTDFVMKLHPEGLGEISVHLRNTEEGISIQMEASAEKTLQAIGQRSGELKAALEAHNVRVSELHLSSSGPDSSGLLGSFSMGRQGFGEQGAPESWHRSYSAVAVSDPEQRAAQTVSEFAEYEDGRLNDKA